MLHLVLASLGFPLWLRLSHYVNLLFIGLLIRSGIEILGAHPRLYCNDGCTPKTEWLKFTKKQVPTEKDVIYTARDDESSISPLLDLPGKKNLGLAAAGMAYPTRSGRSTAVRLLEEPEWHVSGCRRSRIVTDL